MNYVRTCFVCCEFEICFQLHTCIFFQAAYQMFQFVTELLLLSIFLVTMNWYSVSPYSSLSCVQIRLPVPLMLLKSNLTVFFTIWNLVGFNSVNTASFGIFSSCCNLFSKYVALGLGGLNNIYFIILSTTFDFIWYQYTNILRNYGHLIR